MRRGSRALLATVLTTLLAGCGTTEGGSVEFDKDLKNAVIELAGAGGSQPLRELAPGEWTSVHVLKGPMSGAKIERELGRSVEVDGDGTYGGDFVQDGDLLIFLQGEEVVRMVSLGQLAALSGGEYGADVELQAENGAIRMVDADKPSPDR